MAALGQPVMKTWIATYSFSAIAARRCPGTSLSVISRQDRVLGQAGAEGVVSGARVATWQDVSLPDNGATSGIRTPNPRFTKAVPEPRKWRQRKEIREGEQGLSAQLQRAENRSQNMPEMPPDLAQVVAAWHHLPAAVKAGILAMVRAAGVNHPPCSG